MEENTENNNLINAGLDIKIDSQNYIYLACALIVPIMIAFTLYAVVKKI